VTRRLATASAALALLLAACSSGRSTPSSGGTSASSSAGAGGAHSGIATSSSATSSTAGTGTGGAAVPGLGPASFAPGELDAPSHGGTITFEQIGATGWYPSLRDPATGPCDYDAGSCCLTEYDITSNALTPWDEDLVMTLRGPMLVKQIAVYEPTFSNPDEWALVSGWAAGQAAVGGNVAFTGKATATAASFAGAVGSECLVNVSTAKPFGCGSGSVPYCAASSSDHFDGWADSKLLVVLATMPHAGTATAPAGCGMGTTGNWYDASWVGLSVGELVRAGAFSSCQCYAKDPSKGYLADGCGQFNVFEVVNDNNQYKNLDVFSTDMVDYAGYVGQGPCGPQCDVTKLGPAVDLIDKPTDTEAAQGAVATPAGGPTAAFRRPASGYRYFLMALDTGSRTVQLAVVHPSSIPAAIGGLLPALPGVIPQSAIDAVLALRLPK